MATQLVITALLIGLGAGMLSGLVGIGGGIIMGVIYSIATK